MYEINLSTLLLVGIDENTTKVVEIEREFIINCSSREIINNSCKFFGSSLVEKINVSKRLVNISSKSPIIIEESRSIIFFPLKSTREKCNIWISFNNIVSYQNDKQKTTLIFKGNVTYLLDFSYYIVDNQITRSMMLDYVLKTRKNSLKK